MACNNESELRTIVSRGTCLYNGSAQLDSIEDLNEAMYYEWDYLEIPYIRKLLSSLPDGARDCQIAELGKYSIRYWTAE